MPAERHTRSTEHFSVTYPDDLEVLDAENAELVLAFREDDGQFRPSIVFTVEPNTGPVSDASVRVMQLTPEIHRGLYVASVDLWGSDLEARRITMLYPTEEASDVCVREWVWATGEHHIFATASFYPFQWQWAEPTLEWVAQNVVFPRPVMPQSLYQPTEHELDDELTQTTGVALESLDFLSPERDLSGMPIATETVDLLQRTASQLRLGMRTRHIPRESRGSAAASELERLGLAQGDALGPFGESVGQTLAQGTRIANVWMWREGRVESLTVTVRGAQAVIVHTAGLAEPNVDGRAKLVVCGIEQVVRRVLEWIGLPPRFGRHVEEQVSITEVERLLTLSQSDGGWRRVTVEVPEVSRYTVLESDDGVPFAVDQPDAGENELTLTAHIPGELFEELRASIWERMRRVGATA